MHRLTPVFQWISRVIRAVNRMPAPIRHIGRGVLVGILITELMFVSSDNFVGQLIDRLENSTLDMRHLWQVQIFDPRQAPIEDIVILDIDRKSKENMGRFNKWPRSYHASVIRKLKEEGARMVGFDILFEGDPRQEDEHDRALVEAVRETGNVYLALFMLQADTDNYEKPMQDDPYAALNPQSVLPLSPAEKASLFQQNIAEGPFPELAAGARGLAPVTISPDQHGVNRWAPLAMTFNGNAYGAMGLQLAMNVLDVPADSVRFVPSSHIALGSKRTIPVDAQGRMLLHYYGWGNIGAGTFRYISYYDVWADKLPPGFFNNKIVLVGSSLPGEGDLHNVPFSRSFPGTEIHATVIRNILEADYLVSVATGTSYRFTLIIGILVSILSFWLRPLKGGILGIFLMGGYFITAVVLFTQQIRVDIVRPEGVIFLGYLLPLIIQYFMEEQDRKRIKNTFQQYVSPLVIEEVLANPDKLKLGGEKREVTMQFTDLAGFSTISERLAPEELILHLNDYLTEMSQIVLEHDGMIDKYEGDMVVAIYGAPAWRDDHAARACLAAIDMRDRLAEMRADPSQNGRPEFFHRSGVNTGEVIVGHMGSAQRLDYTVIGDEANLSSRLEGANKEYDTTIMISESTYEQARHAVRARELDRIRVKGINRPIRVYELIDRKERNLPEDTERMLEHFEQGLILYRDQQWAAAEESFRAALANDITDGPSQVYIQRCLVHQKNPPPTEWDGVYQLENK